MRSIAKILAVVTILAGQAQLRAQNTTNPISQIRWPLITGHGAPATGCQATAPPPVGSSAYGQQYIDMDAGAIYACIAPGTWKLSPVLSTFGNGAPSASCNATTNNGALYSDRTANTFYLCDGAASAWRGPYGTVATIVGGAGTTLAPGSNPIVTVTGSNPAAINIGVPAAPPSNPRGVWTATPSPAYAMGDQVGLNGSTFSFLGGANISPPATCPALNASWMYVACTAAPNFPPGSALQVLGYQTPGTTAVPFTPGAAGGPVPAMAAVNNLTPTIQMPVSGWTAYHAHGDSITFGTGATTCTSGGTCYAQKLATATGMSAAFTNYGVSGAESCDAVAEILNHENPGASSAILQTMMLGVNDANNHGVGPSEANYISCLEAGIAALTAPSTLRYTGSSFGSMPTNWTLDTTFAAVTGITTSTNASVAIFPYTTTFTGQGVCLLYRVIDGGSGVFQVVDSAGGTTLYINAFTTPAIATSNGLTSGVFAYCPAPSNHFGGSNSITVTTRSAGVVTILGVFVAPPISALPAPSVWLGGVIRQRVPENLTNQMATQTYNQDAKNACNEMFNQNFPCYFVDARSHMTSSGAEMAAGGVGQKHPGDLGHAELSLAFLAPTAVSQPDAPTILSTAQRPAAGCIGARIITTYPAIIGQTESCLILSGSSSGSITLPAELLPAQVGQEVVIVNNGTGIATLVAGPNITTSSAVGQIIEPLQMVTIKYAFDKRWSLKGIGPPDPTLLGYTAVTTTTYQMVCTDQVIGVFTAGSTVLTFPAPAAACPIKSIYVFNVSTGTGIVTFAGALVNGGNVSLSPGQGAGFFSKQAGDGKWYTLYAPPFGAGATITLTGGAAIAAGACGAGATATINGIGPASVAEITPTVDESTVTGYGAGGLIVKKWVTANTVFAKACNPTAGSITPGLLVLNVRVIP